MKKEREESSKDILDELESAIGYKFKERELLIRSLTHRSYRYEHQEDVNSDNERLEFLGDAVLELVISRLLFDREEKFSEGKLSRLRSAVVNEKSLASLSRSFNLGKYLRLGKGEEQTGGRDKDSLLADAHEALIGAVYLDGGFDAAFSFVKRTMGGRLFTINEEISSVDYKTRFQEEIQRLFHQVPQYTLVKAEGPDHDKRFLSKVTACGELYGEGWGGSKKESEQAAAKEALFNLERRLRRNKKQ